MLKQKPYPIRGVCESRCFWQAVVTNSRFYPDAVIDIHAPVNASTGQLNRLAADILISETKSPGVQHYLKDSGAGYRVSFTRLTGQDLIKHGHARLSLVKHCARAKKAWKKPFGNFPAGPRGSGSPEESSSGHNRAVVDSLTDLVFGCRVDVLSLQVDPLRQLVAGEADPGRVVFDEATCPCRCVWRHW
jgi:hypothetical protein